jgi:ABC-2 type transport system ATP-binding protein
MIGAPMIETAGLTKRYGTTAALTSLSLRVDPGEILGFLGPNGAGKSTTVRILAGLSRPTAGRAAVAGFDVVTEPLEAKRRLGYVPETPAIYESLSASEYLDFVSNLYDLEPRAAVARRAELFELFDLTKVQHDLIKSFSKGMRQKVVLSAALVHRPQVLLLDEPLDGLDVGTAMIVKELLKKLAAQGKTILFSSHILEVVERVCTRIVIINQGEEVMSGTSEEIRTAMRTATLEEAFAAVTGVRDAARVTADFLAALERV